MSSATIYAYNRFADICDNSQERKSPVMFFCTRYAMWWIYASLFYSRNYWSLSPRL